MPTPQAAAEIAALYAAIPEVEAVALGGSQMSGAADASSDLDIYVYSHSPIAIEARRAVALSRANQAETDQRFWEPGDIWVERASGIEIDVMFRHTVWISDQLDLVLDQHIPSLACTTCLWDNVLHAQSLFDRSGWFAQLQAKARQPYPEELRQAIIAKSYPVLRGIQFSYISQIELAIKRQDPISINHRIAALLSSYFNVVFALNRRTHPGEKRLLRFVRERCALVPERLPEHIDAIMQAVAPSAHAQLVPHLRALLDALDSLLEREGFTLASIRNPNLTQQ